MFVFALMCVGAVVAMLLTVAFKSGLLGQQLRALWFPAVLMSGGFTVSMPFWLEGAGLEGSSGIGRGNVVVVFEGNRVADVTRGVALCHPWKACANASTSTKITATLDHTVDKKKVHQLRYHLTVAITDFQRFFDTFGVREAKMSGSSHPFSGFAFVPWTDENQQALTRAAEDDLYEFHDARAQELAEFYNPQSPEQSSRLESLLREYVAPRLAKKGIEVREFLGFEVE